MTNEVKLFSEVLTSDKFQLPFKKVIEETSVSRMDAEIRQKVYSEVFENFQEYKDLLKVFSGASDMPVLTNEYFNATVLSYLRSFAGYLGIERSMKEATALLWFLDLLGVTDGRKVLPNTGAENLSGIEAKLEVAIPLVTNTSAYSSALGVKVVPGSLQITLVRTGATSLVITDDRNGKLLGAPGLLTVGTINYSTGALAFTISGGTWVPTDGDVANVLVYQDAPATPEVTGSGTYGNRFKLSNNHITMVTQPDMLIGESNIVSLAAMRKSTGVNVQDVITTKLTELYTKVINRALALAIINGNTGTTYEIDITNATTGFDDYKSRLDLINGALIEVDGELANKSVKGVTATAYLVGRKTADWFRKMRQVGLFTDNKTRTYINDLVGFYDGTIPVLLSTEVGDLEGYAIHKTADGNLAPVMRGIYLPITNTPVVGSYNNPTQLAQGVYYQEGVKSIAPELAQKFKITIPEA